MSEQVFFEGKIYYLESMSESEIEGLISKMTEAEEKINAEIDNILFGDIGEEAING